MTEIDPQLVVVLMFGGLLIGVLLGAPLFICLAGVSMIVGIVAMGPPVFNLMHRRVLGFISDYTLLAVPLFIFMGVMIERSGSAEKLYAGLYLWFGRFRGGLAIATIFLGTILAACVGVIAASVTMIGLVAAPSMFRRGYSKELVCGTICAGGTLGILIPPSIMLVIYGLVAQMSVGKLFFAAIVPGLVLSGLYVTYIAVSCWLKPEQGPAAVIEMRGLSPLKKLAALGTGIMPPLFIILAVLGTIFLGIATPTEAAAIGCLAAAILAIIYHQLNLETIKGTALQTTMITCMALSVGFGASIFTGIFLRLGGGEAIKDFILAMPGGRWGVFAFVMFLIFVLGMFIDWLGILFVMIPLVTPIGIDLDFDPLWFAMMICINLQMSFLTPPFAFAIFFLKGLSKPEWGIETRHIIRGVIPFVLLIMVNIGLCIAFPQIILWLPSVMIK